MLYTEQKTMGRGDTHGRSTEYDFQVCYTQFPVQSPWQFYKSGGLHVAKVAIFEPKYGMREAACT